MRAAGDGPKTALRGVRVLDFTNLLAGPFPSLLLALLGAEVIKIESRAQLDAARRPPYAYDDPDNSPVFNAINLNKLSVQLNLKQPQALRLVETLVGISDVVVENMRPGVMDRVGLGYARLSRINPTLVYASISGAGADGPESGYPGYAPAFNALSGLGHLTGHPDGPPAELHDSIDCRVGSTAAFAVLGGLFHRVRTGQGQHIDLSSREAIAMSTGEALLDYDMNGRIASRLGNGSAEMAPHGCYRCQGDDEWVTIAVAGEEEWQALCVAAGRPEWARDPRFAEASLRRDNRDALDRAIQEWTQGHTADEVAERLQPAGVAASPSMTRLDLEEDGHLKARDAWREVTHPVIGDRKVQAPPWRLSETPAGVNSPGPLLGQHNRYVVQELLGAPAHDLESWVREGIVI